MFLTSQHPLPLAPPRSFASLMELYENNYIYMRRLIPDLDALGAERVVSHAQIDLHLRIVERCRYTTTLSLTYLFEEGGTAWADPDVLIRIYHDARVAEVLPSSPLQGFRWSGTGEPDRRSLPFRWEVNRFLNRWLRFCLGEGHQFDAGRRRA